MLSEDSGKHILLVSYVFPPYNGIGGRRWAKHADELTRLGYTMHVICAQNPFRQNSLWTDLVQNNPRIILYQVSAMFPKVLVRFEHSMLEKLMYRFWISILPWLTRGSYLDRTMLWKRQMHRKARQIITNYKIKNVICSGGPFGAMYQVTLLKKWFKDIFIINDMRDPWTWGPNWGFHNISPKRLSYESMMESDTVKDSDIITVPTLEMKTYLDNKYPLYSSKIKILHHFFDPTEITVEKKTQSAKLRLILYGTIYHHIPELIEETARVIAKYRDSITLDIYTDKHQHKSTFAKYGADNVTFHNQLPAAELFKLFRDFDYVLLTIPGVGVDHISTKFYEIIYSKTPFLVFSKYGLAPKFVVDNQLGVHAGLNELDNVFARLVKNKEMANYNTHFDLTGYSLTDNAKSIESMFKRYA
jgi:hypothetical protein